MFPYITVYVSVQDSEDGKFVNGGVYYAMYVHVWDIPFPCFTLFQHGTASNIYFIFSVQSLHIGHNLNYQE